MNALTRPESISFPRTASLFNTGIPEPGGEGSLFAFQSRGMLLHGLSPAHPVTRGPVSTLEQRLDAFFREVAPGATLAGALPFDRTADDCLWQAAQVIRSASSGAAATPAAPHSGWKLAAEPSRDAYAHSVQRALALMEAEAGQADALEKIVLSRSLLATGRQPINVPELFRRLAADPAAMAFLVPLPERDGTARIMAGATPELLLSKAGARISSHPLAGSARRQPDLAEDAEAAAALMASDKDRREHALVVEFILDTLAPFCSRLFQPEGTALTSTASMWHLGTRIEGELKDPDLSSAVLAAMLHPTPAVCGVPRDTAARHIGTLESYERDFYAGAVGWCDWRGDGAWYVTIRCAEITGATARLYAGAGIVPGSSPQAETEETAAKFGALLNALGITLETGVRP